MANTIITKNSSTASAVPTSGDLVQGELAVNVTDKRLFTENASGTVVELGTSPSSMAVAGNATVGGTLGVTGSTTLAGASVTSLTNSGSTTLSAGTANGVAYLNGSKVLTTGSALQFDGSNLGLGVTPSAIASGGRALQVRNYIFEDNNNGYGIIRYNGFYNGTNDVYITNGYATAYQTYQGQHRWFTAPSGTAGDAISFTQALTLDAVGRLLVGKTSSATALTGVELQTGTGGNAAGVFTADGATAQIWNRLTSDGTIADIRRAGSTVGSISVTSSATTYNTSSDYRLKNITGPITNSGTYIDSLNPVEGTWKADGSTFVGLIAHEAQEVSRTNVATGEKDGEQMQGMDYGNSEFIANIIAELQSLRKRVAQLEAQ